MRRIAHLIPMLAFMSVAHARPFGDYTACTFLDEFEGEFDGCAQYETHDCQKHTMFGSIPGTRVSMYLPEYFIEVQGAWGESVFTEAAMMPGLQLHMKYAQNYFKTAMRKPGVPLLPDDARDGIGDIEGVFRHVRILRVPQGALMLTFPPLVGTGGIPQCFEAVSELIPEQWLDNKGEQELTAAYLPFSMPYCYNPASALIEGLSSAFAKWGSTVGDMPSTERPSTPLDPTCSLGTSALELKAKMVTNPSSAALAPLRDPRELCLGKLGNQLPRTGHTGVDDTTTGGLIAAHSFASLAADAWLKSRLKITRQDKLQQIWPRKAETFKLAAAGQSLTRSQNVGKCSRPGFIEASDRIREFLGGDHFGVDNTSFMPPRKDGEYLQETNRPKKDFTVYAVWKYRESGCIAPRASEAWKQTYRTQRQVNLLACKSFNH